MIQTKSFLSFLRKTINENPEKGAFFVPVLIWGGVAIVTWLGVRYTLGSAASDFLVGLIVWIADFLRVLTGFLCHVASALFDTSLTWLVDKKVTQNVTFITGWSTIRDFANMFIVLGFVIVGIATSLRLQEYEAKKLLKPLIIVAILLNFSGLFCGLIIDASNITSASFIGGSVGSMGSQYYNMLTTLAATTIDNAAHPKSGDQDANLKYLGINLQLAFMYLIVAAVFFYMAIIFMARYGVLAFLYILAPLAFVCKVFPISAAQKIWNDWWQNFLKWAFIGVGGCFSLWISNQMMSAMNKSGTVEVTDLIIILIFLVVGFKITTQSSGVGASAVMGLAGGALGLAAGGVVGGAKGGAKILGKNTQVGRWATEKGQQVKNRYGRAMENIGLRQTGSTAMANSKAVDDEAGGMAKEYTSAKAAAAGGDKNAQARVEKIQELARAGRGARGAAAMKVIADNKDFGDTFAKRDANGKVITGAGGGTDLGQVAQRMKYAESSGAIGIREKAEKLDPRLAAHNQTTVGKVDPADIAKHGSAEAAAVANAYSKASVSDIREFSTDTLKDTAFIENTSASKVEKAASEMSTSKVSAIKDHETHMYNQIIKHRPGGTNPDPVKHQEAINKYNTIVSL
ncbi:MAG: hypothetical protein NTW11_04085 [Candidatus Staskawiczbacteria bacterium]|nr:hypothetical protein [Candidatus Staskawiczbacteria bacterium]